jgi:hypothetical protein
MRRKIQLYHNKFQHSFAILFDISDKLPKRAGLNRKPSQFKNQGGKSETSGVHTSLVLDKKKFEVDEF